MPRNSNGTFTLVAGNPVVSGTQITSDWANTTMADMAQAITESLSREGEGGMNAPFTFENGTVSAPAITWTNKPNTGFYYTTSGGVTMRVSINGLDAAQWTDVTNGDAVFQIKSGASFFNVAHSTAVFDAQVVLANANTYLAPVVAEGSVLLIGLDGRTSATAEAAMDLADSSVQPNDNISTLTNNSGYITANNVPVATDTRFGGFKYTRSGSTLNITIT